MNDAKKGAMQGTGAGATDGKLVYRNHFSYLISKSMGFVVVILLILIQNPSLLIETVKAIASGNAIQAQYIKYILMGFGVLILYCGIVIRRWWKTFIILDGSNLIVHKAVMVDQTNTIALESVSSVNLEQTIFQMILGVYRIRIDTNTSSTANETDVELVLAKARADEFKALVMNRMKDQFSHGNEEAASAASEASVGSASLGEAPDTEDAAAAASAKEVLIHALISTELLAILVGAGALAYGVTDLVDAVREFDATGISGFVSGILALGIAGWSLIGTPIKSYLHLYNFSCVRSGDTLLLEYGLTKHRSFRIPVSKIHGVTVYQTLFARILGYEEIRIKAIGMGDSEEELKNIVLCTRRARSGEKLAELLPEYADLYRADWEHQDGRVTLLRTLTGLWVILPMMVIFGFFIPIEFWKKALVILISVLLILLIRYARCRAAGLALQEEGLMVRHGVYNAVRELLLYHELQTVKSSAGPILRALDASEGVLTCFGGITESIIMVGAFPKARFDHIAEAMVRNKMGRI